MPTVGAQIINGRSQNELPRWNNELYTLYNDLSIVEGTKIRRLEWASLIIRMEEKRIPKSFKLNLPQQWEYHEPDGPKGSRGMHYSC
jgi:hypothetical protein